MPTSGLAIVSATIWRGYRVESDVLELLYFNPQSHCLRALVLYYTISCGCKISIVLYPAKDLADFLVSVLFLRLLFSIQDTLLGVTCL